MIVIGLTGKAGSGKDTVARYMESRFAFRMIDFTRDVLAPILVKRGMEVTRENLIKLAMDGRKKHHNGIWAEKISELIKMSSQDKFVISGVRFPEELLNLMRILIPGLKKVRL